MKSQNVGASMLSGLAKALYLYNLCMTIFWRFFQSCVNNLMESVKELKKGLSDRDVSTAISAATASDISVWRANVCQKAWDLLVFCGGGLVN